MRFYVLTLGILAVWRITHLFTAEDGPGEVLARLRRLAGDGFWGRLLDCFYCLSLWAAAPVAWQLVGTVPGGDGGGGGGWGFAVLLWLSLSAGAVLIERLTSALTGGAVPMPIDHEVSHLPTTKKIEEDQGHVMLR